MGQVRRFTRIALFVLIFNFVVFTVQAQTDVPDLPGEGGSIFGGQVTAAEPAVPPTPAAPVEVPDGAVIKDGVISEEQVEAAPSSPAPSPTAAPNSGIKSGVGPAAARQTPHAATATDAGLCYPFSPVTINFDDEPQPALFADTTALRYNYRALGAIFRGSGPLDGGAILDESSGFTVTGYSAPNFLAFNLSAPLNNGGIPKPPEEILFLGHASFVEILAGSVAGAGQPISMMAYDADGLLVGSDDLILGSAMQPLTITADHIARVVIDSPAVNFLLDDLTFVPEAVPEIIDFDDEPQPAFFTDTTALRDDYSHLGILFQGLGPLDGGAILDETSNFLVEGYSPPNHLAFNKGLTLSDGGIPRPPETVRFATPLSAIQIYAGSGGGMTGNVTMEAFDEFGASLGADSVPIQPLLQPLTIAAEGIVRIEINHDDLALVVDDMLFIRQDIVTIDFDDAVQPPLFVETAALRDEYLACEVRFNPGVPFDGGAVLDQNSSFGVSGFSPRNFLAFYSGTTYPDGGIAGPPERIQFLRPAAFVQLYAGSASSGIVRARAYDAGDILLGEAVINTAANMQPLAITAGLIDHVVVTSTVTGFVVDDLTYVLEPVYEIFLPVILAP